MNKKILRPFILGFLVTVLWLGTARPELAFLHMPASPRRAAAQGAALGIRQPGIALGSTGLQALAISAEPGSGAFGADSHGIDIAPSSGLVTAEDGGADTFSIQLTSQPSADVTIDLSSSDDTEGAPSPTSLTFTPENWNIPSTVTVQGLDDPRDDGDVSYTILTAPALSSDPEYSGYDAPDVLVLNQDDDTAGITVQPASGLVTTEGGGVVMIQIVLNSQPASSVTIPLSVDDLSEGSVSPDSITFQPETWNQPQQVTVTGVDDSVVDGNIDYQVITAQASSADPNYLLDPTDVSVNNWDDDADILISPTLIETVENAGTVSFLVKLDTSTPPSDSVRINLSSSDPNQGIVLEPQGAQVEFTTSNWENSQTVTIQIQDDPIADGEDSFSIITAPANSGDLRYAGFDPLDVDINVAEDDTAGLLAEPADGLTTHESGQQATFNLRLNSQPQENVTVTLSSSNENEGEVLSTQLFFDGTNWNQPNTVTVTGVDDSTADGNQAYTIDAVAESSDGVYNGLTTTVGATNSDDDTAGITINQYSGLVTTELGGTATISVTLNTRPRADVSLNFTSSDPGEGTVMTPMPLVFTPGNWNVPRPITVRGVDDLAAAAPNDGHVPYNIQPQPAVSSDVFYAGLQLDAVQVTNLDNDGPKLTWILPATNSQAYNFAEDRVPIKLQVGLLDSETKTTEVRFLWWDAQGNNGAGVFVTLGVDVAPPYEVEIDPKLLNPEWNQVFALAIDTEGNSSNEKPYIWLFRDLLYRVFSPLIANSSGP
jgi:hypothetical protein